MEAFPQVLFEVSKRHEALSNPLRVLLVGIVWNSELSWKDLKYMVQKFLGREVNPNMLSFHLRRLIEAGLLETVKSGEGSFYRLRTEAKAELESDPRMLKVLEELRKLGGQGAGEL